MSLNEAEAVDAVRLEYADRGELRFPGPNRVVGGVWLIPVVIDGQVSLDDTIPAVRDDGFVFDYCLVD